MATVWLTYRLGQRWGYLSLVVAVLVAFDPILLNQSTLVMTETLAALLAVAGLYGLTSPPRDRPAGRRRRRVGLAVCRAYVFDPGRAGRRARAVVRRDGVGG